MCFLPATYPFPSQGVHALFRQDNASLFLLPIVGIGSMLAVIMLILQFLGRRLYPGIDGLRTVGHLGHLLQYHRIVDRVFCVFAPGKRSMVLAQHGGHRHGILIQSLKFVHNQMPGIFFIGILNLLPGQASDTRHSAVDIVGMCGSIAGNVSSRLGPAGGIGSYTCLCYN